MMKALYSETVSKLAKWLDGGAVVIVGGKMQSNAQQRLVAAFRASRIDWIGNHPRESPSSMEPIISRSDVSLVVVVVKQNAIVTKNARQMCNRHGKLFVRAAGASGIDRIAAEIMAQAGEQLKRRYEQSHQREDE
jgi:hypothetical protein